MKKPRAYTPIPVGSAGELVTVGEFFGVSYDRGYNQPGRHNTRCKVRFKDIAPWPIAVRTSALALNRPPATEEESRKVAEETWRRRGIIAVSSCKAWLSHDFLKQFNGEGRR